MSDETPETPGSGNEQPTRLNDQIAANIDHLNETIGEPIAPPKPSSGAGKKIALISIAGIGLLSLCLVGYFAYKAFSGDSAGAGSPEGVITNALKAYKSQDLLGIARQVDPNEVEPFIDNYKIYTEKLEESNTIRDSSNPLEAYDVEYSDIETKTVKYSDDVARVELLDGTITIRTDKSKLPKSQRDNEDSKSDIDIAQANKEWKAGAAAAYGSGDDFDEDDLESEHLFYIAVKRDGRWYASSLYTGMEYARIAANATGADFKRPSFEAADRKATASDSPEDAVKVFLSAAVSLDGAKTIEATAPDRFSAGHDYKATLKDMQAQYDDNDVYSLLKDAITVSNLSTTSKKESDDLSFVTIDSIDLVVEYSLDLKDSEKNNYQYVPYEVDAQASWNGKCFKYSGTYKVYSSEMSYFPTVAFPITDAVGETYNRDDFGDYAYSYYTEFPVKDAQGKIYPTSTSLSDSTTYRPLPWVDAEGKVVYDAQGNDATGDGLYSSDLSLPVVDANGHAVTDDEGFEITDDLEATYTSQRNNIDDQQCASNRDLKDAPPIGLVVIKENGKYYVSPIDTIWHYIFWAANQ